MLQTLNSALETLPKDRNGKMSKEYLRVALDIVAPSAGLPPLGAIEEVYIYIYMVSTLIFNFFFISDLLRWFLGHLLKH